MELAFLHNLGNGKDASMNWPALEAFTEPHALEAMPVCTTDTPTVAAKRDASAKRAASAGEGFSKRAMAGPNPNE